MLGYSNGVSGCHIERDRGEQRNGCPRQQQRAQRLPKRGTPSDSAAAEDDSDVPGYHKRYRQMRIVLAYIEKLDHREIAEAASIKSSSPCFAPVRRPQEF